MEGENVSRWISATITWFILSTLCFSVSIVTHIIKYIETGCIQYLTIFILIPLIYVFVRVFVNKRMKMENSDNYNLNYIDTNTFIESCAINWANKKSTNRINYVNLLHEYEDISKDLLKYIQWKNAWKESPDVHKEIMILDDVSGEIKIYKGYLKDIERIGQPCFWMYLDDFKKYFIIKNYPSDDSEFVED